ncbi:MAG: hypothetical protein B2I17_08755 [Thermoplasmatales archaeon B_DKE]|nr:MAG: hypothetical protein B2I17_08755 [Thermoplasmatales archaeon B_DKE]
MTLHLCVKKEIAQASISVLKKNGLIDVSRKIHTSGNNVLIPILDGAKLPESIQGTTVDTDGIVQEEKIRPLIQPGSFDVIGHIAILKGNEESRHISRAQEILQTRKNIKTVYLDRGVKGDHRTRAIELIAGEDLPETMYRENGITMKVNVRKAYFSPRLATERLLVSGRVRDGELICDMFSGIGPFSISMARNAKVKILAIDSNCDAINILLENLKVNKLAGTVEAICADSSVEILKHGKFDRIVMNLPHNAFDFIASAYASLKKGGVINYYEINTLEGITERMLEFRKMGMKLLWKRVVHGYSKSESLYSMEFEKLSKA